MHPLLAFREQDQDGSDQRRNQADEPECKAAEHELGEISSGTIHYEDEPHRSERHPEHAQDEDPDSPPDDAPGVGLERVLQLG